MNKRNYLVEFISLCSDFSEMDSDQLFHCKELAIAALSNGETINADTMELFAALDEELLKRGM